MPDEVDLFRGGNRVAVNARWLKKVPAAALELELQMADPSGAMDTIARWDTEEVRPALANDIEHLVNDFVEESRQTCWGRLQWNDQSGQTLTSRRMRVEFKPAQDTAIAFEGTAQSVLAQTQAHQQVVIKTLMETVQYTVRNALELANNAQAESNELRRDNDRLRRKIAEAEADAAQMSVEMDAAEVAHERADGNSEIMNKGVDLIGKAVAWKMAEAAKAAGKPPPPPGVVEQAVNAAAAAAGATQEPAATVDAEPEDTAAQ